MKEKQRLIFRLYVYPATDKYMAIFIELIE